MIRAKIIKCEKNTVYEGIVYDYNIYVMINHDMKLILFYPEQKDLSKYINHECNIEVKLLFLKDFEIGINLEKDISGKLIIDEKYYLKNKYGKFDLEELVIKSKNFKNEEEISFNYLRADLISISQNI